MMAITRKKITDYTFDDQNINKGSVRGDELLEKSINEIGLARSAVADKNGNFIAGNKTAAKALALGITNVIEVETTGDELVVVKRKDLDINTPDGIKAKILDNTVSKHNYVESVKVAEAMATAASIEDYDAYGLTRKAMIDRNVDFKPKPQMHKKGDFYYFTLFRAREKQGSNLETLKQERSNAGTLASHAAEFIRSFFPDPQDCCILTTPARSHTQKNGFHFATEICHQVSRAIDLPFISEAFEARTRQKIEPDIKLLKEITHTSILMIDDIVTTGSTVKACRELLPNKNVFCLILINNN